MQAQSSVEVTAPAYAVVSETQVAVAKTTNVSLGGWSMNKLDDVQLKTIAPPSINNDKNVQALCDAIDVKLREIAAASGLVLLLPRLDERRKKSLTNWHGSTMSIFTITAQTSKETRACPAGDCLA